MRSLSGISTVAIMTKPSFCPGECIYCPGGIANNSPKSYTGKEPAARRAEQNDFDAFRQVKTRISQYELMGHEPEKCELIIMGGTFPALSEKYQHDFVKGAFDGFNGKKGRSLQDSQKRNESAKHRVIGMTFETRPDYCTEAQISKMLEFGATRMEIGVQSVYDDILKKVKRNHTIEDVADATQRCRDSFLKVGYHIMPGLFSTKKKDVEMFKILFSDSRFKPDMLKIYPCLVMPDTPLYEMWRRGEFQPYSSEEAAEAIAEGKRFVPEYCRVMRINRDIPSNLIAEGVKASNLRELVVKSAKEKGISCRCIRCREAGLKAMKEKMEIDWNAVALKRFDYSASGGKEIFLSFEDRKNDLLLGFTRLRIPSEKIFRKEIDSKTAGIRELHVYGEQLQIGKTAKKNKQYAEIQHKGFGALLLDEAEKIAKEEFDCNKLLVLSGIGVKEYYRKLGYSDYGVYVMKKLAGK